MRAMARITMCLKIVVKWNFTERTDASVKMVCYNAQTAMLLEKLSPLAPFSESCILHILNT